MSVEGVVVYGAAGHTGRFVVDELVRRGVVPVAAGRDAARLAAVPQHASLPQRVAGIDDPDRLRETFGEAGASVVLNCAGPYLDTALPVARAAVASGAHYLDLAAEQGAVTDVYRELDAPARETGVTLVPAMAFFGGLADLLVTTVLDGDEDADEVEVAIGLDHWWPTSGTRATGARNTATRLVIRGGRLVPLPESEQAGTWAYPPPFGEQPVVPVPFSEVVTLDRHLAVRELRSYLNTASLEELRDLSTPPPAGSDALGRSEQRFVVDVVVRRGSQERRIDASGRDIYAVSAPIVVEAALRLADGRHHGPGALAPGQAFDAADLLSALSRLPDTLAVRRR